MRLKCMLTLMAELDKTLPDAINAGHFETADAAIAPIKADLKPGDVVLIKGSLGIYVSKIVSALKSGGVVDKPAPQ